MMSRTRCRTLLALAAVVALAGITATSWAWHGPHRRGDAPGRFAFGSGNGPGCLAAALEDQGLSDEQIAQIKDLRRRFQAGTRDLKGKIRQRYLALAAELAKTQPDRDAALAIYQELAGLRSEMGAKRIAHLLDLKAIAPTADFARLRALGQGHQDRRLAW